MQAVWEQAHLSRCIARLETLENELADAKTNAERVELKMRVGKLKREVAEEYGGDAMAVV